MTAGKPRAVFLDRDGVLNRPVIRDGKPYPPATAAETVLVDNASESLSRLKELHFLLIVVTNQPDVRRGTTAREAVEEIHHRLMHELPLTEIVACFHDDQDACSCRKPRPGMLLDAAARHGISLQDSYLIGDRWRDIDAGAAAGCKTILIDYGYNERSSTHRPDTHVCSLTQAVDWIVGHELKNAQLPS